MATFARVIHWAFPSTSIKSDTLATIAIFCGLGLLISLCVASYGIDIGLGFF